MTTSAPSLATSTRAGLSLVAFLAGAWLAAFGARALSPALPGSAVGIADLIRSTQFGAACISQLVAAGGIDGAEERVFKQPVETLRRFGGEKVRLNKGCGEAGCIGSLATQPDGRRSQVKSPGFKACFRPCPRIVPRPATRHRYRAARTAHDFHLL